MKMRRLPPSVDWDVSGDPPVGEGVYFLRNEVTGLVKIGQSCRVASRVRSIMMAAGCQMTYIGGHANTGLEIFFQRELRDKWVMGEWFDLDPEDVEWLEGAHRLYLVADLDVEDPMEWNTA